MKRRASEKLSVWREGLSENGSYKLVALFIALILWLTILGRREFVMNKEIDVEFSAAPNLIVTQQSADRVRLRMSGPQPLLRKIKTSNQNLQMSLADKPAGQYDVDIAPTRFDLPSGVKILSIKPSVIRVEIAPQKN